MSGMCRDVHGNAWLYAVLDRSRQIPADPGRSRHSSDRSEECLDIGRSELAMANAQSQYLPEVFGE
jgi:hypothetical protein